MASKNVSDYACLEELFSVFILLGFIFVLYVVGM